MSQRWLGTLWAVFVFSTSPRAFILWLLLRERTMKSPTRRRFYLLRAQQLSSSCLCVEEEEISSFSLAQTLFLSFSLCFIFIANCLRDKPSEISREQFFVIRLMPSGPFLVCTVTPSLITYQYVSKGEARTIESKALTLRGKIPSLLTRDYREWENNQQIQLTPIELKCMCCASVFAASLHFPTQTRSSTSSSSALDIKRPTLSSARLELSLRNVN